MAFPSVFDGGLFGIAAREAIGQYKAFLCIPNTLIISVSMVRKHPVVGEILRSHQEIFLKHADSD